MASRENYKKKKNIFCIFKPEIWKLSGPSLLEIQTFWHFKWVSNEYRNPDRHKGRKTIIVENCFPSRFGHFETRKVKIKKRGNTTGK